MTNPITDKRSYTYDLLPKSSAFSDDTFYERLSPADKMRIDLYEKVRDTNNDFIIEKIELGHMGDVMTMSTFVANLGWEIQKSLKTRSTAAMLVGSHAKTADLIRNLPDDLLKGLKIDVLSKTYINTVTEVDASQFCTRNQGHNTQGLLPALSKK